MDREYYTFESNDDSNPIKFRSKRYESREECEEEAKYYANSYNERVTLICWRTKFGPGYVYGSVG